MPFYDRENNVRSYENPVTQDRLNNVTRLLCEVMKDLMRDGESVRLLDEIEGLNAWWTEHQELDKKREALKASNNAREARLLKFPVSRLTGPQKMFLRRRGKL